jgi:Fanconi anemia group M protein
MQAECPRILGLTASPGASRQRVQEIRQNLAIQAVEVRDERSEDVRDYVQKTQLDVIRVDFPPEFKLIHENLRDAFNKRVGRLRSFGLTPKSVTKKMLLRLQKKLAREGGGGFRFAAMSIVAQAIRIEHALELLETQGIKPLHNYFKNLQTRATQERKRSLSAVVADPAMQEAIKLTARLHKEGYEHPKLFVLKQIIARFFSKNSRAKIMVFAHFRTSISRIVEELAGMSGIRPIHFVGQSHKTDSEGLKQQEQIRILDKFRALEYNTLVCSSVGEEGLDIPEVDLVVFYDAVPSEIRAIQRRGRTGRAKPGHVIILLTKGTRDESYLWVSRYKEKKMRRALQNMDARQKSLMEFK